MADYSLCVCAITRAIVVQASSSSTNSNIASTNSNRFHALRHTNGLRFALRRLLFLHRHLVLLGTRGPSGMLEQAKLVEANATEPRAPACELREGRRLVMSYDEDEERRTVSVEPERTRRTIGARIRTIS